MNASKANIAFSYLYRDAGNYKQYNTVVFTNAAKIALDVIRTQVKACLIDGEWFYVDRWQLKDLHFDTWDNELDHTWHEFDDVKQTDEPATHGDVNHFLNLIESVATPY
jgi:hypothetical protein